MEVTPLWEHSKENAAPLERGRSVVALERSMAAMESEEDRREQSRLSEHYERLVRTSEALDYEASGDDDPLIHWLSYIKYHQDSFPSDTHSQFLLFERCLRALSPIQKYANDPRFVRVCCMYADKTDRPLEVFQHLHQQRIGSDIAVFWMAWAFKAEQQQNYQFAEKILDKGIRKKAQPLKLLLQRHKQFQRRMTRHWLNATQAEEENEDTLEQSSARGVLGALSDERISRNDRAAVASLNVVPSRTTSNLSTFSDRNASHRSQLQTRSNTSTKGAFAIFVDQNEENSGFSGFNDSTPGEDAIQTRQRLEREEDRKKENTQAVETWNHRGAYTSLYAAAAPPSRAPGLSLAPFAVHVDDECATRQEREEQERLQHRDQHRYRRDERTFRERDTVGVAERLSKDPLHYMRNPEQFATDQKAEESIPAVGKRQAKSTKSNKYAFNKYLLKSSIGKEQCFEEARAHARYFQLALPSSDVNLFFRQLGQKQNDSNMSTSMDETNDDVSFDDVQRPLFRPEEAASKPKALGIRMLTPQDSSFDVLTPRNISTASSTMDEANAVGAPIRRDEQTINTQLALKELSIMFSSPAMGLNDLSVRYNGLGTIMNDSGVSEVLDPPPNNAGETGDTADFAAIAELVGEESNNSFSRSVDPGLNEEVENNGPRNPKPRSNDTPGFDGSVLRTMKEEQDRPRLSCQSEGIRTIGQIAQHDPIRDNEERELDTDPGFTVFNDSEDRSTNPVPSFTIFQDEALSLNSNEHPSRQFAPFQIRNDTQQQSPSEQRSMSRIAVDVFRESATSLEVAADSEGDTATFSLLGDAMDALADVSYGGSTIEESVVEGKDLDNGSNKRQRHESKGASEGFDFGDISRIVPTDDTTMLFVPGVERAVEYNDLHKRDVQEARERISQRSVGRLKPNKSLANILAKPNNLYNLASHVLPRSLRGKKLTTGAGINVGASSSTVKHELGRGVYGVVTLLETTEPALDGSNVIAVKAQSPTDCLAWEFEVMEKLLQRVGPSLRTSESTSFPFARPLTFMSLADGGLLSMTAGSRSGLNLLDLSNFYQVKLQERIPEELVLYYTSRILHHLELLHWHGKMLHCDAKPDNWVLVSSSIVANQELEASDLMLVDFGRAKDLTALHQGLEPLDVKFVGDAVVPDMMCVAMRQGLPWSFDIDTFAACASAHVLLFGSHLQIRLDQNKRWMPKERLHRRLHTVELWTDFFGTLLNLEEGSRAAIGSRPLSLRQLRQRIEAHIGEKHRHATLLRALKHQAALLPSTRL